MRAIAVVLAASLVACSTGAPPTATPTTTPPAAAGTSSAPSPTATPAAATAGVPGSIAGRLAYPSEFIPPLTVYAIPAGPGRYRAVHTAHNQVRYTLAGVPPGVYVVVAFVTGDAQATLSGAYTRYVTCGMTAGCADHAPIPVTVRAGVTSSDVDVGDWYAPPGTFPPRPTGGEPFAAGDRVTVENPLADEVNVRSEPSLGARLLGTLPNGADATVADGPRPVDGYDWYFVRGDSLSGWAVGYALRR